MKTKHYLVTHCRVLYRFMPLILATLFVGMAGFSFAAQSPKAISVPVAPPMFKLSSLTPVTIVVPPPKLIDAKVLLMWNPTPNALYVVFIGTNDVDWPWTAITTNTSYSQVIRVPDNSCKFYGRIAVCRGVEQFIWSEHVVEGGFQPNAVALWTSVPGKSATLQVSGDKRTWTNLFTNVTGTVTNKIQYDRNQFYRAVTAAPPVALNHRPLWEWNEKLKHYGE